jgi:hypothetical protein
MRSDDADEFISQETRDGEEPAGPQEREMGVYQQGLRRAASAPRQWSCGVLGVGALDTEATRRPNVNALCIRAVAGGI